MLDANQLKAAAHREGPANIVAGAGSGKTTVLTSLFANLLRAGERPERILCVTFSKEAALQMASRIAAQTGFSERTLRDSACTFHSLAYRIIKMESRSLGWHLAEEPVLQSGGEKRILRELVRSDLVGAAKKFISQMRRQLISPEDSDAAPNGEIFAPVYRGYDAFLREQGLVDFDSMVYLAYEALWNEEVRECWQRKYRHVIVDEAQDTSYADSQLAKILSQPENNLVQVFDLSQSVYSFRGSCPEVVLDDFNAKKNYFLPTNYRSAPEIIEAFKPFAERDSLSAKLADTMRSGVAFSGRVTVAEFQSEYEEARAVVEEVCRSGVDYSSCAVLARTKACLFPYSELFEEYGVPAFWRGKNFWEEKEIIEAIAFAMFALNPMDYQAFSAAAMSSARETRYLGGEFVRQILATAKRNGISPTTVDVPRRDPKFETWCAAQTCFNRMRIFRDVPVVDFLRDLQNHAGLGFCDSQTEDSDPDDFRNENLEALILRAAGFASLADLIAHAGKMQSLSHRKQGVTLSTVHSAKGLEWGSVYTVGVTDKIWPHARSENFDEERRIMYVALSRAKEFLWVSSHGQKSIFLDMIPQSVKASAA